MTRRKGPGDPATETSAQGVYLGTRYLLFRETQPSSGGEENGEADEGLTPTQGVPSDSRSPHFQASPFLLRTGGWRQKFPGRFAHGEVTLWGLPSHLRAGQGRTGSELGRLRKCQSGDVLWAPWGRHPGRGSGLQRPRRLKSRWPLFSPVYLRADCTGAGTREAGTESPGLVALSLLLLMPCLCALKCFPTSVMLFLSSYTRAVTPPHPGTPRTCAYLCTWVLVDCEARGPAPIVITQAVQETQKGRGSAGSPGTWALLLQNLCCPDVRGQFGAALSPAGREARKATRGISQPPGSHHWERSRVGGGTLRDGIPSPGEAERWSGKPQTGMEN